MKDSTTVKLIIFSLVLIILFDIAGMIGSYLAYKDLEPKIVNEPTWQEVCIDAGIDTTTVGTTTDPTDEELWTLKKY